MPLEPDKNIPGPLPLGKPDESKRIGRFEPLKPTPKKGPNTGYDDARKRSQSGEWEG